MGNKNNFIELNGKRYDAVTGELFVDLPKELAPVHHAPKVAAKSPHTMDDIVRPSGAHHPVAKPKKPVAEHSKATELVQAAPTTVGHSDVVRAPKHSVAAHQPQHAKTLMRHVVHKPSDSLKRHLKAQTSTDALLKTPLVSVIPKLSFNTLNPTRIKRAERIAKSQLVRRFAPFQPLHQLAGSGHVVMPVASPRPQAHPTPTPPPLRTGKRSMDIFEQALAHANSHEQPAIQTKKHHKPHTKRHKGLPGRRAMSTVAVVAAIVLLGGFIGLQNKANITMRVAASKAGFHATLPGYKPAGFAVGKFSYSPGVVAVNFHSNSDSRAFKLTQQTSNWDSETLLDNYVATNSSQYQAFQDTGQTVYIYGNNDATWVNNGIWYQITDNGSLSTNQVLQLAQSM